MTVKETIRATLDGLRPRRLSSGYLREAAVLMPVFERQGRPFFLLTRRTEEVSTHKGQISFPGGMRQNGEDLLETALRETYEEVAIAAERIQILGRFHEYLSITGHRVVPFAGYIDGTFLAVPQAAEVAEILEVPFDVFTDPSRLRSERRMRFDRVMDVYFYRYEPGEIWGLTAHIIKDFFEEISHPGTLPR